MLEPRYIEKESFTIVGVAVAGQLGEFNYGEIWEKLYKPIDAILKPYSVDGGCYGLSLSEGDHMIYLAGVAVEKSPKLPNGVEKREIPAAKYAVFSCTLNTMVNTMQEVYGQWFHKSGYDLDTNAAIFEYYPPIGSQNELPVDIYIPVKLKNYISPESGDKSLTVFDVIKNRRSIRKFKNDPVSNETLRKILSAGTLAPSGKNSQPWRFYVVTGEKRVEMSNRMRVGIARSENEGRNPGSARYSLAVMEQAPVTIFIFNPTRIHLALNQSIDQVLSDRVDTQSIGASIQNMILTAEALGLGSLWICDVFYAYEELSAWLGEQSEMIAAVAFGVPDEHPVARKRKSFDEVVHWV